MLKATRHQISRTIGMMAILALLAAAAPASAYDCAQFISEGPPYDYASVPKNSWVNKTWNIKNCGDTTWTTSWGVKQIAGNACVGVNFNFTASTPPGSTAPIWVSCYVGTASQYSGYFKVRTPGGTTFGDQFWFIVNTY